jgi:hypothetical protein
MSLKLKLEPLGIAREHDPGGTLTWDPETGELSGYYAAEIRREAERLEAVSYTPLGLFSDKDPLKDREAMAILLLSMGFRLPTELQGNLSTEEEIVDGILY